MKTRRHKPQREPTIALINIVFLMLIFFLIAGTVAPPLADDLKLINTSELDGTAPPSGLVIHADGRLEADGQPLTTPAAYVETLPEDETQSIRLIPDRALPAAELLRIGAALRAAGATEVIIATEKALQ